MSRVKAFLRKEMVFCIALAAALLSFFITPPGKHILEGIDTATLLMLFTLMTVVEGFRSLGMFDRLGAAVTGKIATMRGLAAALVTVCFFLSMVATNDVALISLVPFTLVLMGRADSRDTMLTLALETIAANLGSMVTPIGNPQNLYLYSSRHMALADFFRITWPYALVSLAALLLLTLLISRHTVQQCKPPVTRPIRRKLVLYTLLTVFAALAVAKVAPPWLAAVAVLAGVLLFDPLVLQRVDFMLLGTFICFFVFVSSVKACVPIRTWLEELTAAAPLVAPLCVSQVISNVPACLLLSPFTADAEALLLGVNLGGLGTLVASLASLISFKAYSAAKGAKKEGTCSFSPSSMYACLRYC